MAERDTSQMKKPGGRGVGCIDNLLRTLPSAPGVYRMLDDGGRVLYVGKAKSLRHRVAAYTQLGRLSERLRRMVGETANVEIITTQTEAEALLLEANLIKRLNPRFNILLRDDKSYPWLMLSEDHPYPRLRKHRGAQTGNASYWGPFASAWSVNQTIQGLQRVFLLRTCADPVFSNRTRPCLLYQIRRCSAPCVGRISRADYAELVSEARKFLSGRGGHVQRDLAAQMEHAAKTLEFEQAASLRDRIRGLTQIQGQDVVNPGSITNADVIAISQAAGRSCVQVFFIRGGHNNGNRSFFPEHDKDQTAEFVLSAFIGQFYDDKDPPGLLLLNRTLPDHVLIAEALKMKNGHKVEITVPKRGEKRDVVHHAEANAREALERKLAESAGQEKLLAATGELFGLEKAPRRIEVYDNSHMMGSSPYGVMIVAGPEGFIRSAYRKFAIHSSVTPGDDLAMLREVLTRRFARTVADGSARDQNRWPDLVLIDGGAGQLSAALVVLNELQISDVPVVAVAKGPERNAGRERFFTEGKPPFQLPERDPVLYFLQRLRDEAHRFEITTHRMGRNRKISVSELDAIAGVGSRRKRALLHHFGSVRAIEGAGLRDLEAVSGISRATACSIYTYFHPGVSLGPLAATFPEEQHNPLRGNDEQPLLRRAATCDSEA